MKSTLIRCMFFPMVATVSIHGYSQHGNAIPPLEKVTLPEAHIGNLEVDTRLLDSYEILPDNVRQFYLDARAVLSENSDADFTDDRILKAARKHGITLMAGPMLGDLREDGVNLWLRPSAPVTLTVNVAKPDGSAEKSYTRKFEKPGVEQSMSLDGLSSDTDYTYVIYTGKRKVAEGSFRTAPSPDAESIVRLAFGSCFHKIGLHNPNLMSQILNRKPHAMIVLGDIAVDDRDNKINMHRSDYLLRDISAPWRRLSAQVPIYSSWDDHDYLNNDLGGIPHPFTEGDRRKLRMVWRQNWNNPPTNGAGVNYTTRLGPVELVVLDTRSFRNVDERGKYGSYLGVDQQNWLKETLKNSTAMYKVISSGTMWSDDVTDGKDSWGTWDTLAREEIFKLIETENISGVVLISGDRHGARGFTIRRPSGYLFYEFEAASLGGVPGPEAMAKDSTNQLFGYHGADVIAFGELTFDSRGDDAVVTFRLIDERGNILEEHPLSYTQLTPKKGTDK